MTRRGLSSRTKLNIAIASAAATLGGWIAFTATDQTSAAGAVAPSEDVSTAVSDDSSLPPIPTVVPPVLQNRGLSQNLEPLADLPSVSDAPKVQVVPNQPRRSVRTRSSR